MNEEGKRTWRFEYRHAGCNFVLYEDGDSLEDALSKFKASLVRLSPVVRAELKIVQ